MHTCVKMFHCRGTHTHTHCSPLTRNTNKEKLKHMTIHDANGTMNVVASVGRKKGMSKKFVDASTWMKGLKVIYQIFLDFECKWPLHVNHGFCTS